MALNNLTADQAEFVKRRNEHFSKVMEESGGGNRDFLYKERVQRYQVRENYNQVRILPPTWEGAIDWAYTIFTHYQVGVNKGAFLCLNKMKSQPCPVCEEVNAATKRGDSELARALQPQRRMLSYVIDRQDMSKGPLLWAMPFAKVYKQLVTLTYSRTTGQYLWIDNEEEGRDISFEVHGKQLATQYVGLRVDWEPSSLSQDLDQRRKWLDAVRSKPIPDLLQFKEYEYIKHVVAGEAEVMVNNKPITSASSASKDADINAALPDTAPKAVAPMDISRMNKSQLLHLIEARHMDIDPNDFPAEDELRSAVQIELGNS